MNKVTLSGRLTKDPEVRYTQDGKAIAKWSLAVDRRFKKEEGQQADFFECTAFGKLAEHLEKYWKKGMKMLLFGRLEYSQWKDKEGHSRTSVGITVEEVEFCEKKDDRDATPDPKAPGEFLEIGEDEELPFNF